MMAYCISEFDNAMATSSAEVRAITDRSHEFLFLQLGHMRKIAEADQ